MTPRTHLKIATLLGAAGTLFSGYLSLVHALSNRCAFNELCSTFLGYPACYFGFGLFAAILVTSAGAWLAGTQARWPAALDVLLGLGGSLFAAYFFDSELGRWSAEGFEASALGLPTCAYGLAFFVAVLGISLARLSAPFETPGVRSAPSAG
jgi:hypothetical protein